MKKCEEEKLTNNEEEPQIEAQNEGGQREKFSDSMKLKQAGTKDKDSRSVRIHKNCIKLRY